jgi:hypothetical protein
LNATPTVPFAVVALVIEGAVTGAAAIVMVRLPLPVPPAFVALIETELMPAEDGVPLINPVVVLIVSPAGRPVAANDVGLLLPVIA